MKFEDYLKNMYDGANVILTILILIVGLPFFIIGVLTKPKKVKK